MVHPEKAVKFINRFLPGEYVRRSLEKTPVNKNRAFLVVGPRQAGKSTMVWHQLVPFAPDILFLNMEDPLLRSGGVDAIDFAEYIQEKCPSVKAIFIDEIQHMEEAGALCQRSCGYPVESAHLDHRFIRL